MPTVYNTQSHDTVMTRAWRFNEKKTYTTLCSEKNTHSQFLSYLNE